MISGGGNVFQGFCLTRARVLFDPDYQAVLDFAIQEGYNLPSQNVQNVQNQLVIDLKFEGIWSKLKSLYVFASGGDSDFSCIDWKRLTEANRFGGLGYDLNEGFTGNGTNAYLDLNYNPVSLGDNANSFSFGGYELSNISEGNSAILSDSNTGSAIDTRLFINTRNPSNEIASRFHNSSLNTIGNANSIGFYHLDRRQSSSYEVVKNGTVLVTANITQNGFFNGSIWSLRFIDFFSNRTVSVLFVAESLYDQRVAFNDIIQNYISEVTT